MNARQFRIKSVRRLEPRKCVVQPARTEVELAKVQPGFGDLQVRFEALLRLYTATRELGGIVATKAALDLLGLPGGPPRPPRLPADDATVALVRRRLLEPFERPDGPELG